MSALQNSLDSPHINNTAITATTLYNNTIIQQVSYADLYQMASAAAIELAGGPKIALRYGRLDVTDAADCAPEGRLPGAGHPFSDGSKTPAEHLRNVFYRMGLNDKEIVALSGAHTLGRARPERSGWGKESTKYTDGKAADFPGGKPGGQVRASAFVGRGGRGRVTGMDAAA